MRPTELLQEIRKMCFEESFNIWTEGRITQEGVARILNISSRTKYRARSPFGLSCWGKS